MKSKYYLLRAASGKKLISCVFTFHYDLSSNKERYECIPFSIWSEVVRRFGILKSRRFVNSVNRQLAGYCDEAERKIYSSYSRVKQFSLQTISWVLRWTWTKNIFKLFEGEAILFFKQLPGYCDKPERKIYSSCSRVTQFSLQTITWVLWWTWMKSIFKLFDGEAINKIQYSPAAWRR